MDRRPPPNNVAAGMRTGGKNHEPGGDQPADQRNGGKSDEAMDAGCGTGRVGRELARRGLDIVGVDIDPEMLDTARRKAPGVDWRLADLATVDLSRSFDAIVMAGNVMIFLKPGTESVVVANMARHLQPDGLLIAGFQIMRDRLTVQRYDEIAANAGLALAERWSTWDRDAWDTGNDYAVSVHRRAPGSSRV